MSARMRRHGGALLVGVLAAVGCSKATPPDAPSNAAPAAVGTFGFERVGDAWTGRHGRLAPFTSRIDHDGVRLTSDALGQGRAPWTMTLRAASIERPSALLSLHPAAPRLEGDRISFVDPRGVREWFGYRPRGVEEGIDVESRPAGEGALRIALAIDGLTPRLLLNGGNVELRDGGGVARIELGDLHAHDATGASLAAHFVVAGTAVAIDVDDRGATYPIAIDPLISAAPVKLIPTSPNDGDTGPFGWGAAMQGTDAFVSGRYGFVPFSLSGSTWSQQPEVSYGGAHLSAALDDGLAVFAESNVNEASVYARDSGGIWSSLSALYPIADPAEEGVEFGAGCAISGDLVAIGATNYVVTTPVPDAGISTNATTGAVYMFSGAGTAWTQQAIVHLDAATGGSFGSALALSGQTLVVGVSTTDGTSGAYVFTGGGSSWSEQAELVSSDEVTGDGFGGAVAIDGDMVVVGASNASNGTSVASGAAYVFTRAGTLWTEEAKLTGPAPMSGFGADVAVSGSTAVVGSLTSGTAIYAQSSAGSWDLQTTLSASVLSLTGNYGSEVGIDGTSVIVGGQKDGAGAAYVYDLVTVSTNGGGCSAATDCASGFCVDGVCCESACTGTCMACSGALKGAGDDGVCGPIANGLDPKSECTSAASCSDGGAISATCNGAGACASTTTACGNFACNSAGTACVTSCATIADCVAGASCVSGLCAFVVDATPIETGGPIDADLDVVAEASTDATSVFTAPVAVAPAVVVPSDAGPSLTAAGGVCGEASECASGFCVEGICCASACGESCSSCRLPGHLGVCTVEPIGVDLRGQCAPSLSCVATCDGAGGCIAAGEGTLCARNACTDGSHGVGAAICSGEQGTCELSSVVTFDCTPFACLAYAGACASSCASSDDCAGGFVCDDTRRCVAVVATSTSAKSGCSMSTRAGSSDVAWLVFIGGVIVLVGRRGKRTAPNLAQLATIAMLALFASIGCARSSSESSSEGARGDASTAASPSSRSPAAPISSLAAATFSHDGGALVAHHVASHLDLRVDAARAEVRGLQWRFETQLARVGRAGALRSPTRGAPTLTPTLHSARASLDRGNGVTEWYAITQQGIEQGFDVERRPPGDGLLRLEIESVGLSPSMVGHDVALSNGRRGEVARYGHLRVRDASGASVPASLGVVGGYIVVDIDDAHATYPLDVDPLVWALEATLVPNDPSGDSQLGQSVAIDRTTGTTLVVGAPAQGSGAGAVYVFVASGTSWSQQAELTVPSSSLLGTSVSISGDTLTATGGDVDDGEGTYLGLYVFVRSGTVWAQQASLGGAGSEGAAAIDGDTIVQGAQIYVRTGTAWALQATLLPLDTPGALDSANSAAAVDGNLAAVGAPDSGAVYLFARSGTTWAQQQRLAPPGTAPTTFGEALSLSGSTLIVGEGPNGVGGVYVYAQAGTTWSVQATLAPSSSAPSTAGFGSSVAVSGNLALVGFSTASNPSTNLAFGGEVYAFARSGTTWTEQAGLFGADAADRGALGAAVALGGTGGTTGVAGAPGQGSNGGAAYVWTANAAGTTWTQQAEVISPDADGADNFGTSVALDVDTAIVGAPGKNASAGAAYLFTRDAAGAWQELQKLVPSDPRADSYFGSSVALDGDTALVAAYNYSISGAVYVFVQSAGGVWSQQAEIPSTVGFYNFFADAIALSGDTALVGVDSSILVYTRTGTSWSQQTTLPAGGPFSIDGDTVIVSSLEKVGSAGAASVSTRVGTTWSVQATLTASDGAANDAFGSSVSVVGNVATITNGSGSVYVFSRAGTAWSQVSKLAATSSGANDVSLSGTTAAAYAFDPSVVDIFAETSGAWAHPTSISIPTQYFGETTSLSLSGDTFLLGAPGANTGAGAVLGYAMRFHAIGDACTLASDCASGFCADGVCCNSACNDGCDTCSLTGSVGTCTDSPVGTSNVAVCGPYLCNGISVGCTGGCGSADDSCIAGDACVHGVCQPLAANGEPCLYGVGCTSGFCADGVCCNTACNAACDSCDVGGQVGTCSPVAAGSVGTPSCAPFVCDGKSASCPSGCVTDADCAALDGACVGGVCEGKIAQGGACTTASSCASGFCADGVCCDAACIGTCMACTGALKGTGLDGTCGSVAVGAACGAPSCGTDARVTYACASTGACVASGTSCGAYACVTATAACGAACASRADCAAGFGCVGGTCISATPSDAGASADAIADVTLAEPSLDATSPVTQPTPVTPPSAGSNEASVQHPTGVACAEAGDCASGFCVEGVCCDGACGSACRSCVLPGSVGHCTSEPLGIDLRNDCGPARSCVATCNGSGECIGAGPGTLCTRNACIDGSHVLGAAACSGFQGTCQTDQAQTIDCSPFACEPAFGACAGSCATSDDCAPGFVCDGPSGKCIAPTRVAAKGGCSWVGATRGGSGGDRLLVGALLVIAGGVARRRRGGCVRAWTRAGASGDRRASGRARHG